MSWINLDILYLYMSHCVFFKFYFFILQLCREELICRTLIAMQMILVLEQCRLLQSIALEMSFIM